MAHVTQGGKKDSDITVDSWQMTGASTVVSVAVECEGAMYVRRARMRSACVGREAACGQESGLEARGVSRRLFGAG